GIINIEIHVQQLEVEQPNGYSDINIRGTANDVLLKNNAFGPMNLSDLAAENVFVDCHGTNNTFVQTRKSLTGSISNVGDLYYSGNPETVNVNVTGDGQLIHIE
ncbi:MAG: DUF2807 domain-containing protein, partial [Bacteroidales bacterium]|nr:DUF2807 domain-containing protein [Bacteroidales bacterium]